MNEVVLFTPFHPDSGGGAVVLRTLIAAFSKLKVRWLYLGDTPSNFPNSHCIAPSVIGQPLLKDLSASLKMWTGWGQPELGRIVTSITREQPAVIWTVAMNEGIPVGNIVAEELGIPLHVSVHDDQVGAIAGRSRRYWWMAGLMRKPWLRLLRRASSIDVISDGMKRRYAQLHHVDSFVCHRVITALPEIANSVSGDAISVGHIGNVYSNKEYSCFLLGLRAYRETRRQSLQFYLVGSQPDQVCLAQEILGSDSVTDYDHLNEIDAVRLLGGTSFVYAMYPFDAKSSEFRRTSLPTKLSTYVQSQRPIFAHAPMDSTLAEVVSNGELGYCCSDLRPHVIAEGVEKILSLQVPKSRFEGVRSAKYG
ncbi:glycosyltransferase [Verrucomicrobium spinosum]|nr:glycosyltransferase [Verrucomicrobium spinosum]